MIRDARDTPLDETVIERAVEMQPQIYRIEYGFAKNRDDAQELTQDVLTKVVRKAHQYNPELSALDTWITGVALSVGKQYVRTRRNRIVAFQEPEDDDNGTTFHLEGNPDPRCENPLTLLLKAEKIQAVRNGLEKLSERMQPTVRLRYFAGMTYNEIIDALQITFGKAKSDLYKGKKLLREHLAHCA